MKMTHSLYPFPPALCSRPTATEYRILTVSEGFTFVHAHSGVAEFTASQPGDKRVPYLVAPNLADSV